jgi:hypothetical protein
VLDEMTIAGMVGAAAGIVVWRGYVSLDALAGERVLLRSTSETAQVIEYGCAVSLGALGLVVEVVLRRAGVEVPWPTPIGSVMAVFAPLAALALFFIAPRVTAWVGIGAPKAR